MRIGFIFSLPRAGSTYVQRVLSGAPDVSTTPETWFLTSLLGTRYGSAPMADFAYDHVRRALDDLLQRFPGAELGWRNAIRSAAETFFASIGDGGELFLEKTPRNAAFSAKIIEIFPDSPSLILWRNPLGVIASINETWGRGHWKAYFYYYDLYYGLLSLLDTARSNENNPNVMQIRYESLVSNPTVLWPGIFAHFNLDTAMDAVSRPPMLIGAMGDPTGQFIYSGTQSVSVDKWMYSFGGIRSWWARRYLDKIGKENLAYMGYDIDVLKRAIGSGGIWKVSDFVFIPLAPLYHALQPKVWSGLVRRLKGQAFSRR